MLLKKVLQCIYNETQKLKRYVQSYKNKTLSNGSFKAEIDIKEQNYNQLNQTFSIST